MSFAVYPALDASDDEEYIFKPKAKSQIDEAWNPKARVGPLLPKTNRPAREGAKKTSVEKGLEAAAAKRAKQSVSQLLFCCNFEHFALFHFLCITQVVKYIDLMCTYINLERD